MMKGSPNVIKALCGLVKLEATSMAQFRLQAQVLRNDGYKRLKHKLHGYFYSANDRSKKLINRILLLGGEAEPRDIVANPPTIGVDVVQMFSADVGMLGSSVMATNLANREAFNANDNGTCHMLHKMIEEKEKEQKWLEMQLSIIDEVGKAEYLADRG
jgi:bacterioferritin